MKILYGIQLNGNGHINRSLEIIDKLRRNGYNVDIITSGNNSNLKIKNVKNNFKGFSIFYKKDGNINWIKTLLNSNIFKLIYDILNIDIDNYNLIISDFEPISAWSSKINKKKSIGISNQYSLIYKETPKYKFKFLSKYFTKYFAKCDYYIGLNYLKFNNNIEFPIISNNLLNKKSIEKNFYLIYLPQYNLNKLIKIINNSNNNFVIYSNYKNIKIKPINKNEFQYDLLNCKGVITASGFSTTSECLILNKKLWSIPIKQYEQLSNSIVLNEMGIFTKKLNKKNLNIWINNFNKINYKWENPIDNIIKKIINIYEN